MQLAAAALARALGQRLAHPGGDWVQYVMVQRFVLGLQGGEHHGDEVDVDVAGGGGRVVPPARAACAVGLLLLRGALLVHALQQRLHALAQRRLGRLLPGARALLVARQRPPLLLAQHVLLQVPPERLRVEELALLVGVPAPHLPGPALGGALHALLQDLVQRRLQAQQRLPGGGQQLGGLGVGQALGLLGARERIRAKLLQRHGQQLVALRLRQRLPQRAHGRHVVLRRQVLQLLEVGLRLRLRIGKQVDGR